MKTSISFINEEGKECSMYQNQGMRIQHECWDILITRGGQMPASEGNEMIVDIKTRVIKKPLKFNKIHVFWSLLNTHYMGRQLLTTANAETYRNAFASAFNYVQIELKKYDDLVEERNNALIRAEL